MTSSWGLVVSRAVANLVCLYGSELARALPEWRRVPPLMESGDFNLPLLVIKCLSRVHIWYRADSSSIFDEYLNGYADKCVFRSTTAVELEMWHATPDHADKTSASNLAPKSAGGIPAQNAIYTAGMPMKIARSVNGHLESMSCKF